MTQFLVKAVFEITDGGLVIIMGVIEAGEISPGMFARIPIDANRNWFIRIHSIESVRSSDLRDICLSFESEPGMLDILKQLNLSGKTILITTEPEKQWVTLDELKEIWK